MRTSSSTALTWTIAILAGSLAGVASAAARPSVVPQQGIAGVRLGMTQGQVQAKAGPPRKVERGTNELGSFMRFRYATYTVTFFGGPKVTMMETRSPTERTPSGVGVASTRAQVAARVKGVKCVKELGYDHCYVGTWKPGRVITDFSLRNGRVTRIVIGYVTD